MQVSLNVKDILEHNFDRDIFYRLEYELAIIYIDWCRFKGRENLLTLNNQQNSYIDFYYSLGFTSENY